MSPSVRSQWRRRWRCERRRRGLAYINNNVCNGLGGPLLSQPYGFFPSRPLSFFLLHSLLPPRVVDYICIYTYVIVCFFFFFCNRGALFPSYSLRWWLSSFSPRRQSLKTRRRKRHVESWRMCTPAFGCTGMIYSALE